jgi:hypothetical protein
VIYACRFRHRENQQAYLTARWAAAPVGYNPATNPRTSVQVQDIDA